MKVLTSKVSILAGFLMIALFFSGWSKAPQKNIDLGLGNLKESQAYAQFLNRPVSEYSKALFLVERFKSLPYEIVYDGHTYKIKAVAGFVTAFLRFNYKKDQLAKHWVLQYANRSMLQNELIMVRLPDGRSYRAGDILIKELESLEKAVAEIPAPEPKMDLPNQFNTRVEAPAIAPEALPIPAAN